jgi:hypothetical protein
VAKNERTILATAILPVASLEEAKVLIGSAKTEVLNNGNLKIDFGAGDKSYSFEFVNSRAGYVLKK